MDRKGFCIGLERLAVRPAQVREPVYRAVFLANVISYPACVLFLCLCLCLYLCQSFALAQIVNDKMTTAIAYARP